MHSLTKKSLILFTFSSFPLVPFLNFSSVVRLPLPIIIHSRLLHFLVFLKSSSPLLNVFLRSKTLVFASSSCLCVTCFVSHNRL
jgi:hypothetical protein